MTELVTKTNNNIENDVKSEPDDVDKVEITTTDKKADEFVENTDSKGQSDIVDDVNDKTEIDNDSKKNDTKQKWKLKIRVSDSKTSDKSDNEKEWEVISDQTFSNEAVVKEEEDTDIDVELESVSQLDVPNNNTTPISPTAKMSRSATMVDALTPKKLPSKRKVKRKSYDSYSTTLPLPKKTKGGLRSDCPPFCKANCTYSHHPLLSCARKMIENDSASTLMFLDTVASYYGGDKGNMKPSDLIFDPWKNTEFPLLHYIALMGKCAGSFAMIDAGHHPDNVKTQSGDTVLHTLIKEMYLFNCTHGHMDILLKKFCLLLKEFRECLLITDQSGKNTLHLCASMISHSSGLLKNSAKPPFRLYQFQKNMLTALLKQFKTNELDACLLNNTDNIGNTFSHYLAEDRASFDLLDQVKEMGANFDVRNNAGNTVSEAMNEAPPPPPSDMLELAEYSAKGKAYKAVNPSPSLTSKRTRSKPSPKKSECLKSKPSPKKVEFMKDKPKTTSKTILIKPETKGLPMKEPSMIGSITTIVTPKTNKARVKITPTRKEKLEQKLAKIIEKKDTSCKENLESANKEDKTVVIADSLMSSVPLILQRAKTVLPKPVLIAISTANTTVLTSTNITSSAAAPKITSASFESMSKNDSVKIVLPNSSTVLTAAPSVIAKVKPITMNSQAVITKPLVESKVDIPIKPFIPTPSQVINSSKTAAPTIPTTFTETNKVQVNQMTSTNNGQYVFLNSNNNQNLQPIMPMNNQQNVYKAVSLEKPMIVKTADGSLMQLSVATLPNSFKNNQPPVNACFQPNQNLQTVPMYPPYRIAPPNVNLHMMLNGGAPQRLTVPASMMTPNALPNSRPININGQWIYPIVSSTATAPVFPSHFSQPPHPQQLLHSPPSMANHLSPPGLASIRNPTFFPQSKGVHPSHVLAAPRPLQPQPSLQQQVHPQLRSPFFPTTIPHPQQQQLLIRKQQTTPNANTKRGRNLEASIRNLQNISMDIVNAQTNMVSPTQQTKSPTKEVPPPTEEPAPPVYIIDTDDEHAIFTDDNPMKIKVDEAQNNDHKTEENNDFTHKECITERECKYHVQVHPQSCQHFEKFLIANALHYTKLECCQHEPHNAEQEADNPFLGSRPTDDRPHLPVVDPHNLARKLSEWFLHSSELCKEHFASYILSRRRDSLERMLSMDEVSLPLSQEETKAWIKIEHFLTNEQLRGILTCSCYKDLEEIHRNASSEQVRAVPWEDDLISQQEVHQIADKLRRWLHQHPWVSQGYFATHYLNRSQGTISNLLRWATAPTSKQGEEVWFRIKHFLENEEVQKTFSLNVRKHRVSQTQTSGSSSNDTPSANSHKYSNEVIHQEIARSEPYESRPEPYEPRPESYESRPESYESFTQGDIHALADRLTDWLQRYPFISQNRFSKHVLQRTQGTLSSLLKLRCLPISRAGQEVWIKIRDFLNDPVKQEALLKMYGWMRREEESSNTQTSSERKRFLVKDEEAEIPTQTVTPFKVQRLGDFDQNTVNRLAEDLKCWLECHPRVSQGFFAQTILSRSQGTLSLLLIRKAAPISKSGEEVWRKIRDFLHDPNSQEELLRLANQQYQ